ncbi:Protein of unknown function DUF3112 [Penicillium capsulatum]|uniref:Uncharacterized protein n=1 Tax=Penicillium capsulatum TaxID=69766 RepID=A0A9W9IVA2_9EURO|nr:Protein of unknown function DUF3112 [Penicillium capsulatum]KAJ6129202.1 Protein of unknown function DUF3112 [Penicillium capsulatum]
MGGPYPSKVAALGGLPTIALDVPVCVGFAAMFLAAGISHMTLFLRNKGRGHKFIPSAATFGFCMSRVVANAIRIGWAYHPTNVRIAIAAAIFVAAGILILFILNLLYAQRMLRAVYPGFGWSRPVSVLFKVLYALVIVTIIMMITVVIQNMYTLNANTKRIDRDIQLYGVTYFAIISFLPLPIVAAVLCSPRRKNVEEFGSGPWYMKVSIVAVAAVMLCLGASWRAAGLWMPPSPVQWSPWYDSKACFYIFDFGLDLATVLVFLLGRVDLRFHVPDGSSQMRFYRNPNVMTPKTIEHYCQCVVEV